MGICYMAQETQTGALYQPRMVGWGGRWEGVSKGRGYMYTYGSFMLRYDRKQQNSLKQLSFNKKQKINRGPQRENKAVEANQYSEIQLKKVSSKIFFNLHIVKFTVCMQFCKF